MHLAEALHAPVVTTLAGKSAFPEDHPLSLGTGGRSTTGPVVHFLRKADVVFGVGTSLTRTNFGTPVPPGKVLVHATNDERDINKDYTVQHPLLGDAQLVLQQLLEAVRERLGRRSRDGDGAVAEEIARVRQEWLRQWMPKLTSDEVPLNPYRVMWDLFHTFDPRETIVTHDSGSPRDQLVPFYPALTPHGYIGWGKSTQLGYGLGLIMGAKLAAPEKLCVNLMGDTAFGMVGLDFETAVRSGIPILTVVLNNSAMAIERPTMGTAHERYRSLSLGGNYADIARALGGWAERVERPEEIVPALQRARQATQEGRAALLEFITCEEISYSVFR